MISKINMNFQEYTTQRRPSASSGQALRQAKDYAGNTEANSRNTTSFLSADFAALREVHFL